MSQLAQAACAQWPTGEEQAFLFGDFALAGEAFGVFGFAAGLDGFKPGRGHRAAQFRLADERGDVFHPRPFGGEKDAGFEDSLERGERFLQAAGVVVVAHALDEQVGFAGGDAVPRAFDAPDQVS
jgi:hypothetical protein